LSLQLIAKTCREKKSEGIAGVTFGGRSLLRGNNGEKRDKKFTPEVRGPGDLAGHRSSEIRLKNVARKREERARPKNPTAAKKSGALSQLPWLARVVISNA